MSNQVWTCANCGAVVNVNQPHICAYKQRVNDAAIYAELYKTAQPDWSRIMQLLEQIATDIHVMKQFMEQRDE